MQDFGSTMVCPQALVLVFVLLLRIAGQPCPSSDRLLLFLLRVNPFTLDQYIDGWCRSGLDSLDPDRSWCDWSDLPSYIPLLSDGWNTTG